MEYIELSGLDKGTNEALLNSLKETQQAEAWQEQREEHGLVGVEAVDFVIISAGSGVIGSAAFSIVCAAIRKYLVKASSSHTDLPPIVITIDGIPYKIKKIGDLKVVEELSDKSPDDK